MNTVEPEVSNIFEYVSTETEAYRTRTVPLTDGWDWGMFEHIRKSFLYKHSKFSMGANDGSRPFKNIILPILNVAYRSEGFDVKDVVPYVDDVDNYYKSFFIKKYHPRWAKENGIDRVIDASVESYVDYGLTLVENVNGVAPQVVNLQSIAFCDQTDILSGPLGIKLNFSPDELIEMPFDKAKVEEAITLSLHERKPVMAPGREAETPGKYIEVYKVTGMLPEHWLEREDDRYKDSKYVRQVQYITFYHDESGARHGITLFKGVEPKNRYKALKRDDIFGRTCGWGGVEELFEPQTWTNYSEIHIQKMLKAASLMVLQTADPAFKNRNRRIVDLEKNEILHAIEPLSQVAIQPQNIRDFREHSMLQEQSARGLGSASDPQLGITPTSGTPLGTTEIVTNQGIGIHDYRRGQIAAFWEEIYREWVLPHMVKEIGGKKFLEELSLEEMQYVGEALVDNLADEKAKEVVLKGGMVAEEDRVVFKELAMEAFKKGGSKRFLEVLHDDLKGLPVDVQINVAGKQKNLAENVDKLSRVLQLMMTADPARLKALGKTFNEILEKSELSPVDFASFTELEEEKPEEPEPVSKPLATVV